MKQKQVKQVLNIGLEVSETLKEQGVNLSNEELFNKSIKLIKRITKDFYVGYNTKQENGGYEPVLKVYLKDKLSNNLIKILSILLYQDCISVFNVDKLEGELIGTRLENYGLKFNHKYFKI
jgi:hypothetical protein